MSKMKKIFAITITVMFIASIGAVTNIGNQNNNFVAAGGKKNSNGVGADLSEYTVPEADYTVNTVGNLTNAVAGKPFKNSTGGKVSASSGDTILLEAETYNVDSTIDVQLSNITIAGEESGSVIKFSKASDLGMNVNASNVTIEGFELSGPENITAIHANSNADNLTVQSNTFTNADGPYSDSDYPITTSDGPNIALKIGEDNNVTNVTFINNNVTGYVDGVWAEGQNTDNLYVLNNDFNDIPIYKDENSYYGVGVQIEHGNNLRVENNTFTGNIDQGDSSVYTDSDVNYNHYAVVTWTSFFVSDYGQIDGGAHIKNNEMTNLYLGTCAFTSAGEISGNDIDNNYIGIQIGQFDDVYATAPTQGVSIEKNDITNNYRGIWVQFFVPDGMHASHNNIMNNSKKGIMNEDPEGDAFNATYNWWGDPSGPSGVGLGEGDAVSENVIYSPWLDAPHPGGKDVTLENTVEKNFESSETNTTKISGIGAINITADESGWLKLGVPSNLPDGLSNNVNSVKTLSISSNISKTVHSIKFNYTEADIESIEENSLMIYRWNGTAWNPLSEEYNAVHNTTGNYIQASPKVTSTYILGGSPQVIGGTATKSNPLNVWLPYIGIIGLISLFGGIAAYSGKEWFKNN